MLLDKSLQYFLFAAKVVIESGSAERERLSDVGYPAGSNSLSLENLCCFAHQLVAGVSVCGGAWWGEASLYLFLSSAKKISESEEFVCGADHI